MPNILTKRPLTPLGWAGIALLGSGLVLALLGIANLGFASYFPLVGLWCSVALFVCARGVLRTAGVTLDFFHRAVLVAFWAAAVLYLAQTRALLRADRAERARAGAVAG